MPGTIFFRERRLGEEGTGQPRFQLVAIVHHDLRLYGKHLRMAELKAIAEAIGADLVQLPSPQEGKATEEERVVIWALEPSIG